MSMGQVAFEAMRQSIASATPLDEEGLYVQQQFIRWGWEEIPPMEREAWEAAAQAVLAERDSQNVTGTRAAGEGSVWAKVDPERYSRSNAEQEADRDYRASGGK
jgi:hypothetical protein